MDHSSDMRCAHRCLGVAEQALTLYSRREPFSPREVNVYSSLEGSVAAVGRELAIGMDAVLEVVVNGEKARIRARTLAELLVELGYGDAKVATARNGNFVPLRKREMVELSGGDTIEIVSPRQGG
jgi:sulfur carrier protein